MLRELEEMILARLRGTDQAPPRPMKVPVATVVVEGQPVPDKPVYVPVSVDFMIPEDFNKQPIQFTRVNVWRFMHEPDPTRFRTGTHHSRMAPDRRSHNVKRHQVPFKTGYEISVRTRYQEQFKELTDEIRRRLPPIGYGSQLIVPLPDGDIIVPFRETSYSDRTDTNQSGERSFVATLSYEFDTWEDLDRWTQENIVREIVLDTDAETLAKNTAGVVPPPDYSSLGPANPLPPLPAPAPGADSTVIVP
jgi:hypothetical protein